MKILLIRNDNIGDLICTTPAIEALRKKYPKAQIDIVVNSYNFLAIRNNPFIDKIYVYTKTKHIKGINNKIKVLFEKTHILWQIKKEKYDIAVVFRSGYSKSAEIFSNVSNAFMRIGVKDKNNKDNFTHHIVPNPKEHEVEFCYSCLESLGVDYNDEKLFFYVEDLMIEKFKNYDIDLLFHISARLEKNQMSFEKLKHIFLKLDKEIYITADPKDWNTAKRLEQYTKAKFIKTDSFLEWAGVIKNSKFMITLEGGAMHIAPALGIKTMALFGGSNINKWFPWGYKNLVIQDESKRAENIDSKLIVQKIKENL